MFTLKVHPDQQTLQYYFCQQTLFTLKVHPDQQTLQYYFCQQTLFTLKVHPDQQTLQYYFCQQTLFTLKVHPDQQILQYYFCQQTLFTLKVHPDQQTLQYYFCQQTLFTLKVHPDQQILQYYFCQNVDATLLLMSKSSECWKIVNVHRPYANVHLIDPNRAGIRTPDDANLLKLLEISEFADHMSPSGSKCIKQLTRVYKLSHTCNGLGDLSTFILNTNHEYVALGNFTTDPLEKQFGQQVLEKVSIYQSKLLLQLDGDAVSSINLEPGLSCSKCGFLLSEDMLMCLTNYQN